ncbi:MAG: JAB domain-containing protein [Thermodesulfobacteriota bacterium]
MNAIADRAASVIFAHNHPSGTLHPTSDDIQATQQLVDAGRIVGISVLDDIIITRKGLLSMKDEGLALLDR